MMKILYFGTVCAMDTYEYMIAGASHKPSVAPIVFETALLEGFSQNGAQVEVYSFPMIPAFPQSKRLGWFGKKDVLSSGYTANWLNTVNIPVLKQWSRAAHCRRVLRKWLKANPDGAVLMYSIPPFLVSQVIKACRKFGNSCFAVIADLPRDMYSGAAHQGLMGKLKRVYLKKAIRNQSAFDGYVYLTQAMADVIAPGAPYTVVEGIAHAAHMRPADPAEKSSPRSIMYAGALHKQFGTDNLVQAFLRLPDPDTELWIFGRGSYEEELKAYGVREPRIRFFGNRSREEVLECERKATLLVNVRGTEETFTKYSFPSKTIEYMLSGTPMLSTRLQGIPEEYFDYIFPADSNDVQTVAEAMERILAHTDRELADIGNRAQSFVAEQKNARIQAGKILEFMNAHTASGGR